MYAYKKIKLSDGSTIDEHRLVMQNFLKRKLNTWEHVHHKDGNKRNNKLSNLEVISSSEHARLHGKKRRFTEHQKLKIKKAAFESSSVKKLKNEQVIEIRKMLLNGFKVSDLAILFKVHKSTISRIKNEKTYDF